MMRSAGSGLHNRTGSGLHCRTGGRLHCRTDCRLHCRTDCRSSGAGVTVSLTGTRRRGAANRAVPSITAPQSARVFFIFKFLYFSVLLNSTWVNVARKKVFFKSQCRKNSKVFPCSSLNFSLSSLLIGNHHVADFRLTFLHITAILYRIIPATFKLSLFLKPKENNNHGCFFKRVSGSFRDLGVYIH